MCHLEHKAINMEYLENIQAILNRLNEINSEIKSLSISVLDEGILKPSPGVPLGEWFTFDKELYLKEELDPNVKILNQLRKQISNTIMDLQNENPGLNSLDPTV